MPCGPPAAHDRAQQMLANGDARTRRTFVSCRTRHQPAVRNRLSYVDRLWFLLCTVTYNGNASLYLINNDAALVLEAQSTTPGGSTTMRWHNKTT